MMLDKSNCSFLAFLQCVHHNYIKNTKGQPLKINYESLIIQI